MFIYNIGIRIGSALQIRWSWVNFEARMISLKNERGVKTLYEIQLNEEALNMIFNVSEFISPDDNVFQWTMHEKQFTGKQNVNKNLQGFRKNAVLNFTQFASISAANSQRKISPPPKRSDIQTTKPP
ncbi:MAG: hypothetical protein LBT05_14215 [Planctomycetaceae bacterium]|nr:hypothetical protein [Planctomycetaceae bacterium]